MKDLYYPVLDDGFIALKDYMGDDYSIEQAARVSYGKGTRKVSDTRNLIRYLMRHHHTTPFEMVEFKFHVRVPMDCWRQWIRHRMASVNEYSTRYSEAIDSQQKTSPDKWRLQSKDNKQGSSGYLSVKSIEQGNPGGKDLSDAEQKFHVYAKNLYETRLRVGVAKEQARKDLPLSTYTEAYWKIDLKNLFHFLKLRCDSHAQEEIRAYAYIIAGIVKQIVPIAFEAWYDYSFMAENFTRIDLDALAYMRQYGILPTENYLENQGISKREREEFWNKLQPKLPISFDLPQPIERGNNL